MPKEHLSSQTPKKLEQLSPRDLAKKIAEDTKPLSQSLHELLDTIQKIKKTAQEE